MYTASANQYTLVIPQNNPILVNGQDYFFVVVACNTEGLCGPGAVSPYAAPYAQYQGDTTYDSSWTYTGAISTYQSPDNITGLLVFDTPDGTSACSASVIPSTAGNLIATAAHCVNEGGIAGTPGTWFSNFTFIPAYNGDAPTASLQAPYGYFLGFEAWAPDLWLTNSDFHDDFAVIAVGNNTSGQSPQQAVGSLGIEFRAPLESFSTRNTGYPAQSPYNSNLLYGCTSNLADREKYGELPGNTFTEQSDGSYYGYGCDGGQGMSGGPNTYTSSLFGADVLISVRSYHDGSNVNHRYGPYFGMEPELLWHIASGM